MQFEKNDDTKYYNFFHLLRIKLTKSFSNRAPNLKLHNSITSQLHYRNRNFIEEDLKNFNSLKSRPEDEIWRCKAWKKDSAAVVIDGSHADRSCWAPIKEACWASKSKRWLDFTTTRGPAWKARECERGTRRAKREGAKERAKLSFEERGSERACGPQLIASI